MIEPPRLHLAQLPTPLTKLERFSQRFDGVNLWVKRDEMTGTEVSGNKIRKLEFSIAQAQAEACDTLITCGGLQSNHCRTTAILGARLGMKVYLILRGDKPGQAEGNLLMDYLCGAEIIYVAEQDYHSHGKIAQQLQLDLQAAGHKSFFIPIGASDEIGVWGYITASAELKKDYAQHGFVPEYTVLATGSGGSQAGLIAGYALHQIEGEIAAFNVCDDAQYFERKIRLDLKRWKRRYESDLDVASLQINTIEGYVGPGYAKADKAVFDCIAELASSEGIFLDPVYTGKAFHGLVSELKKGQAGYFASAKNIVFIHTGGIFGVFPQQQGFKLG
ncbi:MAG: D-cysteine desulfhydrase [SAR86 cluster bacterium]|uniref:D-cysteine desulfhydrase n=1 Tax=SAR86 cluster bacterium TaxID=2030880 RepID=A0A2A4MNZ9_9GAMM|nr:MAG: D-cysteine desulfhydrase [SAR86 cluster bacterium]